MDSLGRWCLQILTVTGKDCVCHIGLRVGVSRFAPFAGPGQQFPFCALGCFVIELSSIRARGSFCFESSQFFAYENLKGPNNEDLVDKENRHAQNFA